ncbi:hypothetical protein [Adlercreutzia sp. ZJ141]|uniref:hypothetical protein n=1 Tax=Adlercreutzia sp. ZJ141 TaxID=2709406 RepID=UPI0013ED1D99|nr:hypothetical protein [Adlercreutzia sp. ZJ141]
MTAECEPYSEPLGPDLTGSMQRAYAALQDKWKLDKACEETVYQIDVPAQTLTIYGEESVRFTIRTLKGLGITGTYRSSKKGC